MPCAFFWAWRKRDFSRRDPVPDLLVSGAARGRSVGLFYYGAPIALTLGSPLSGLLVAHDALGLHGWQVMFLIEGLMASLGGIAVLFLLKDRPIDANWLSAEEKQTLIEAFAEDERRAPRRASGCGRPCAIRACCISAPSISWPRSASMA